MECDNKSVVQGAAPVKGDVPALRLRPAIKHLISELRQLCRRLTTGRNLVPGSGSPVAVQPIAAVVAANLIAFAKCMPPLQSRHPTGLAPAENSLNYPKAHALPICGRTKPPRRRWLQRSSPAERTTEIRGTDAAARQNIDGRELEMVESRRETEQRANVTSTAATRPTMFCAPLSERGQDGRRK